MSKANEIMKNTFKFYETYLNNKRVFLTGNSQLLHRKKIGIFVSRSIPLNIVIPAEEFLLTLSDMSYIFVSGWHSPFERRILKRLLANGKNAIFFTSKGIKNQQLYSYITKPFQEGKILIASLISEMPNPTLRNSIQRNEVISESTDYNLFIYINRRGNLEELFEKLVNQDKMPLVFNHSTNAYFLGKGKSIGQSNFKKVLK